MAPTSSRPPAFERLRELPLVGRAMDWGMGPRAVSRSTRAAGARMLAELALSEINERRLGPLAEPLHRGKPAACSAEPSSP